MSSILLEPTPCQKAINCLLKNPSVGISFDEIAAFFHVFGKVMDPEEEAAFKKRYFPDDKKEISRDIALQIFSDFIKPDDFILMLQTEAEVLNPKTQSSQHHIEDFRWMLKQVGEEISDLDIEEFMMEVVQTQKADDLFDLNLFIQYMCQYQPPVKQQGKKK